MKGFIPERLAQARTVQETLLEVRGVSRDAELINRFAKKGIFIWQQDGCLCLHVKQEFGRRYEASLGLAYIDDQLDHLGISVVSTEQTYTAEIPFSDIESSSELTDVMKDVSDIYDSIRLELDNDQRESWRGRRTTHPMYVTRPAWHS